MRFSCVTIYCTNIERSVAFYRDIIGMEVVSGEENGSNPNVCLLKEPDALPGKTPIIRLEENEELSWQSGKLIGFTIDSIERIEPLLKAAGYRRLLGPYAPDKGFLICEYEGPDGEQVGIMEVSEA